MNAVRKLSLVSDRDRALDALAASPAARKAQLEHEALTLAKRKELAAQRSKLDEIAGRDLPKLQADVDVALKEFLEAQNGCLQHYWSHGGKFMAAKAIARAKLDAARDASMMASLAHGTARDSIERELRRSAAPSIALFVSEMRDAWFAARSTTLEVRSHLVRNPITGKASEAIASNAASITARMIAIRAAINAAETMALEADQSNVDIRLEKLRQALPAIGGPEIPKDQPR